ncbi:MULTISPECIES: SprT family zinc-dependent metalloprotease [unclassified Paracoccus (in: a-proteobacteria)]|uniref:M48 family metallopeptidase n=1 Tax=unclassified Paracoccus (in: a-proteobacteria) TaxID=2688777 RepID=UPI001FFE0209|nr:MULTISPECIES: SprT family zinc-dependent metalloprotease [unclassified Paracoccus (in: a-proteobacteria)]
MDETITIADGLRIALRRSARARRMILRVPRDGGDPVLTLPSRVALAEGLAFAEARVGWLREATARRPGPRRVEAGVLLPVEGLPRRLMPASERAARLEPDRLLIPQGRPPGPVVQGYLKHLAHDRLRLACDRHAAALGRQVRAISLRDTRSRWGSCTADGRLMFSWRLAMAPPQVLDYVAAHEVAHLAHMDHSPRFWATVERLMPGHGPHRAWLRQNGADLMVWKFRD